MNNNRKPLIVFAAAAYNLAETGRMIEIAQAARSHFEILFISYGGAFENLIETRGFSIIRLEPRLTEAKLKKLKMVLSGETWNTVGYFSYKELLPRVAAEVKFFKESKPQAVLTGWCLSVTLSARIAKVPFVNVLHSTSISEYYEAGLQTWPDRLEKLCIRRWIAEEKLTERFNKRILTSDLSIKSYNRIGKKYGLSPFKSFIDLIEGDHILLADIPSWVGLEKVRSNVHHIGPLPFKLDIPVPPEVINIKHDKALIFFAMGSSGKPRLVKQIIEGFQEKPYRVIAPVRALTDEIPMNIPENVIITDYLPAHLVNPMADVAVIHGGQNTVMNACLSGTPIVGIGMHPEQEANLEACVRKGFAIRLNKWTMKAEELYIAIDKLLADKSAKNKIMAFRQELQQWDGPAIAAQFLYQQFGIIN